MKLLFLISLVILMPKTWARPCAVFGISDSPQKLTCFFKTTQVMLSCQQGTYYLNQDRVSSAYHLEVESGPVPLVFKADRLELIVHLQSKTDIPAELEDNGRVLKGECR
jgi:hypothetical protein